jgi:hypothetical protein
MKLQAPSNPPFHTQMVYFKFTDLYIIKTPFTEEFNLLGSHFIAPERWGN